jgi:hypothetical protein
MLPGNPKKPVILSYGSVRRGTPKTGKWILAQFGIRVLILTAVLTGVEIIVVLCIPGLEDVSLFPAFSIVGAALCFAAVYYRCMIQNPSGRFVVSGRLLWACALTFVGVESMAFLFVFHDEALSLLMLGCWCSLSPFVITIALSRPL